MSPEDRVDAITDFITVTKIYNRAIADGTTITDAAAYLAEKSVSESLAPNDTVVLAIAPFIEETCPLGELFEKVCEYARGLDDSVAMIDALETALAIVRDYADATPVVDASTWALDTLYADSAQVTDTAVMAFAAQIQELVSAAEEFARTVDFVRAAVDTLHT